MGECCSRANGIAPAWERRRATRLAPLPVAAFRDRQREENKKEMATTPRLRFVRDKYLKQWSTHAYKMEYGGYLSNHLLHGLVALGELGASESHIETFAERYVKKLRVVEDRVSDEEAPAVVRLADAKSLIGKRENFEGLRAMYEAEIQHLTADGAVTHHLPSLVGGLAGALLHGIIQLGYAYRVGGDLLIAEGLAYLHFSHLSFDAPDDDQVLANASNHPSKPLTREAVLEIARTVQENKALLESLHTHMKTPTLVEQVQGDLQRRLMCFSSDSVRGDPELFKAVKDIVDQFDFSNMNGHVALDFSMWLFNIAPTNDFVLLHATTSAWSLRQVEHLLSADDRVRAWKVWFRVALSAFTMHEIPPLPAQDPCELSESVLASLPGWDEITARALALEGDVDEHVYKLVQVACDVAAHSAYSPEDEGNANLSSFLTPTQREAVTRLSALKVISMKFDITVGNNEDWAKHYFDTARYGLTI